MAIEQLELWKEGITEERCLWTEIYDVQNQHNNLRKGFFSRHKKLKDEIYELKKEILILKEKVEGKTSTEFFELEFYKHGKG